MRRVVVVGLGPAGADHLTAEARSAIDAVGVRYLRTARHPAAGAVQPAASFDALYETSSDFEEVYYKIVGALVDAASENGVVLYAVPGSPSVAERSVELLRADPRVEVEIVAGMSFLELAWARLGLDPLACGVKLLDGPSFALESAGETGPFLLGQCWSREVLSGIKLALGAHQPPDTRVTVLQRLGLPSESVSSVPLEDLDRTVDPDHLTSVFVPSLGGAVAAEVAGLDELVRTLRQRCPWDRCQTHRSLVRHLLEETYEVIDAIEALDGSPASYGHLEEELGDLLFQVCFHATLAREQGQFGLADVARGVHEKLVARHPHVFGDVEALTAEAVVANWEQIKKAEKGRSSLMEGIPESLPATALAQKVLRKVASVGIEPVGLPASVPPAREVPHGQDLSRSEDLLDAGELGDLLLSVVELARRRGVDAELALRSSARSLRRRFEAVEVLAESEGVQLSSLEPQEAAALWARAGRPQRG